MGAHAGGAGNYSWGGGAPSTGYKWDTGEDDPDDPKKPQKGAPPQMSGEAATATTSEEDNPEVTYIIGMGVGRGVPVSSPNKRRSMGRATPN